MILVVLELYESRTCMLKRYIYHFHSILRARIEEDPIHKTLVIHSSISLFWKSLISNTCIVFTKQTLPFINELWFYYVVNVAIFCEQCWIFSKNGWSYRFLENVLPWLPAKSNTVQGKIALAIEELLLGSNLSLTFL